MLSHICLDIIPAFAGKVSFDPGRLIEVGPAMLSTGGAVSNTGQALHKLGVKTRLCGKIGDDIFGQAIREILDRTGVGLSSGMIVAAGEASSYSVVISLTGEDRMFLHAPGCNDTFTASDVTDNSLAGAKLIHFGYPTLMAKMFADGGHEMEALFRRAKALGTTTSLDMSLPDLAGPAGRTDWLSILKRVLPHTDLFLPNVEELQFMLDPDAFSKTKGQNVSVDEIRSLSAKALGFGAKIVCIKAGARGLYMSTQSALTDLGRATPQVKQAWEGIELWAPCFRAEVVGTTGAGDATVAGLLMGLLKGMSANEAARAATAVGACSCEVPDAVSGIQSWDETERRIQDGWPTRPNDLGTDWTQQNGVFVPVA